MFYCAGENLGSDSSDVAVFYIQDNTGTNSFAHYQTRHIDLSGTVKVNNIYYYNLKTYIFYSINGVIRFGSFDRVGTTASFNVITVAVDAS